MASLQGKSLSSCCSGMFITKTCPCNKQRLFELKKNENFQQKNFDIFLIFAQNIDCGYTLGMWQSTWILTKTQ